MEVATVGGGCFWCLEACYRNIKGVRSAVSGYAGGPKPDPTYEQVCGGKTGHAEVVQITYDTSVVSFQDILNVFFYIHDPTTLNRQGNDVGTQYRSAIFYHNATQKAIADQTIAAGNASGEFKGPIVTQVVPLEKFYAAEEYHQDYFNRNPGQGYCTAVVAPKYRKFTQKFRTMLVD